MVSEEPLTTKETDSSDVLKGGKGGKGKIRVCRADINGNDPLESQARVPNSRADSSGKSYSQ